MKAITTYYDVDTGEILTDSLKSIQLNYIKIKSEKTFNYEKDLIIWRTGWKRREHKQLTIWDKY